MTPGYTYSAPVEAIRRIHDDAERYRTLIRAAGHWQDGSSADVKLFQDDATCTCIVIVGKNRYERGSFDTAVDALRDEQRNRGETNV